MKLIKWAFAVTILCICFVNYSCKNKPADNSCSTVHWTYEGEEGPDHCADLCPGFSACKGSNQSPIDILTDKVAADTVLSDTLHFSYGTSKTYVYNSGHTVQANTDSTNSIALDTTVYTLAQFHFHTVSEHTLNGSHSPMEIHLVNKNADGSKILVVGLLVEEGAANPVLTYLTSHLPQSTGASVKNDSTFNVNELLPASKTFYTYKGSLTTPPCSETVTWCVMKNKIFASKEQIAAIHQLIHEDNRPVQPLNGRIVLISK